MKKVVIFAATFVATVLGWMIIGELALFIFPVGLVAALAAR